MSNWKRTPEDNENIIAIYKARKTIKATSTITGWSKDTVIRVLTEAGLYWPKSANTYKKATDPVIKWDDPNKRIEGLTYQERTPKVYDVVVNGKRYKDVTELYGG